MLDDLETARAAADELDAIAGANRTPGAAGDRRRRRGRRPPRRRRPYACRGGSRARAGAFDEIDLIYESARVSLLLGRIHQAGGNDDDALAELTSAVGSFDAIGAVPDAMKARELLGTLQPSG